MIILDFSVDFNYNLPSFIRSQRPNYIKQKSPKVRKEKLMIEKYAAIISALSDEFFISTGIINDCHLGFLFSENAKGQDRRTEDRDASGLPWDTPYKPSGYGHSTGTSKRYTSGAKRSQPTQTYRICYPKMTPSKTFLMTSFCVLTGQEARSQHFRLFTNPTFSSLEMLKANFLMETL